MCFLLYTAETSLYTTLHEATDISKNTDSSATIQKSEQNKSLQISNTISLEEQNKINNTVKDIIQPIITTVKEDDNIYQTIFRFVGINFEILTILETEEKIIKAKLQPLQKFYSSVSVYFVCLIILKIVIYLRKKFDTANSKYDILIQIICIILFFISIKSIIESILDNIILFCILVAIIIILIVVLGKVDQVKQLLRSAFYKIKQGIIYAAQNNIIGLYKTKIKDLQNHYYILNEIFQYIYYVFTETSFNIFSTFLIIMLIQNIFDYYKEIIKHLEDSNTDIRISDSLVINTINFYLFLFNISIIKLLITFILYVICSIPTMNISFSVNFDLIEDVIYFFILLQSIIWLIHSYNKKIIMINLSFIKSLISVINYCTSSITVGIFIILFYVSNMINDHMSTHYIKYNNIYYYICIFLKVLKVILLINLVLMVFFYITFQKSEISLQRLVIYYFIFGLQIIFEILLRYANTHNITTNSSNMLTNIIIKLINHNAEYPYNQTTEIQKCNVKSDIHIAILQIILLACIEILF